jgi:LPS-assembly lipoprotein
VLIGLLMLAAGCGFTPVYAPGGVGGQWQNKIVVDAPDSVIGFRMNARLSDVFGPASAAEYILKVVPQIAPVPATITVDGDITRFNLTGNATWILSGQSGSDADGLVQTFTSYSATGSTVATQAAESDARARLAIALSDLIVQQILVRGVTQ